MATADLHRDSHRLTLMFEQEVPERLLEQGSLAIKTLNGAGDQVVFSMPLHRVILEGKVQLLPHIFPESFIRLVMMAPQDVEIGFIEDGALLCNEKVIMTPALCRMLFDPIYMNTKHFALPRKPGKVAILMQAYNEGEMLLYWENYYAKMVGHENLYVLDNASTDGSVALLNPKTTVIHMPPGPVDHVHFAQAQGYFQRFLLLKYDWVVKTDTDELIVLEGDLVETLERLPRGTYYPEAVVETVHHVDSEPDFDWSGGVYAQRKHHVDGTNLLIRPIISSEPTSWSAGNHNCFEPSEQLPGLWLVHLKYFDFNFLSAKNNKWSRMEQTENESKTCRQISVLSSFDRAKLDAFTDGELAERLADKPLALPTWMVGKF